MSRWHCGINVCMWHFSNTSWILWHHHINVSCLQDTPDHSHGSWCLEDADAAVPMSVRQYDKSCRWAMPIDISGHVPRTLWECHVLFHAWVPCPLDIVIQPCQCAMLPGHICRIHVHCVKPVSMYYVSETYLGWACPGDVVLKWCRLVSLGHYDKSCRWPMSPRHGWGHCLLSIIPKPYGSAMSPRHVWFVP